MDVGIKLVKTAPGEELDTEQYPYCSVVGTLLYLCMSTRPDISFAVGALARYMSLPSMLHWQAAMGVLRYLAGTRLVGLRYSGTDASLHGWSDADYAGDISTRRSTTGYVFTSNGAAISWSSRLQPTVATSTLEAEYMAAAAAAKEALWLRKLRSDLGMETGTVTIFSDNQGSLSLMDNPVISDRSKHIDVHYHFLRERSLMGQVSFTYISTAEMLADIFTKALPAVTFGKHAVGLGMGAALGCGRAP